MHPDFLPMWRAFRSSKDGRFYDKHLAQLSVMHVSVIQSDRVQVICYNPPIGD